MLSKYSADLELRNRMTKSRPSPSGAAQVKLGSCPKLSANPVPTCTLTDTPSEFSAFARHGDQQRCLNTLCLLLDMANMGAPTNSQASEHLSDQHVLLGTGQSTLYPPFPNRHKEQGQKTVVPILRKLKCRRILWQGKNLKIRKRIAIKSPSMTLSKPPPLKWRGKLAPTGTYISDRLGDRRVLSWMLTVSDMPTHKSVQGQPVACIFCSAF